MLDFENLTYFSMHNHTDGSNGRIIDSIIKTQQLVDNGQAIGLAGVSITDHECLSSLIEGMDINNKLNKEGSDFKIGLGNEIYLVNSMEEVRDNYQGGGLTKFPHFVLVAKNEIGFEALRMLSTEAWKESFNTGIMKRVPTTKENFAKVLMNPKYKGSVIGSTSCLGGEIPLEYRKYINGDSSAMDRINKFVGACQTVLGENNFYLEIQPGFTEEQIQYNQFILMYGRTKSIKVIFTTDSHYLKKEDANLHSAFLNSKDAEREVASFYSSTYMMSTKEVWEYFEDYVKEEEFIEMCNNSMDIYNSIEIYNTSRDTLVPQIPIPPFSQNNRLFIEGVEYNYINKMINSEHLIDRYLISNLHQGMIKYNQDYSKEELDRLNIELEQIWEISEKLHSRLSSYYLLTKDIVDIAWTVSLVGAGRGSSCGFYICYLLGITQLNPMKHEDLKYWRHLEKSKYSLPDIDVDFEPDKKPQIIELIKQKYGYDRVLNIVTFKTLTSKASINTVGKGLGYTNDEISAISGTIPFERGKNWSLSDCVYGNEEKNRKPVPHFKTVMDKYPNLVEYAMLLEGLRTNISVHASGLYVMDEDYRKTNSLMITPGGESVTAWNMEQSDSQGALKVDILLIDALSKIRSCMDLLLEEGKIEWKGTLRDTYEFYIHPDKLVMEGEEVFKPIYNGVVTNVFQFETPLGQQVLRKVAPHTLYELCNANSLMRLSTKETEQPLERYIRYKGNINEWYSDMKKWGLSKEEINIMKEHLLPRYGMAEVQESVMTLSMDGRISNFTLTESDKLRKGLAKGKPKLVQECRELFYKKGKEAGTSLALLDYVWDKQISMSLG